MYSSDQVTIIASCCHSGEEGASWLEERFCTGTSKCFLSSSKNAHSDLSCECTANGVNVFERCVMLAGDAGLSLAVTISDRAVLTTPVCSVRELS